MLVSLIFSLLLFFTCAGAEDSAPTGSSTSNTDSTLSPSDATALSTAPSDETPLSTISPSDETAPSTGTHLWTAPSTGTHLWTAPSTGTHLWTAPSTGTHLWTAPSTGTHLWTAPSNGTTSILNISTSTTADTIPTTTPLNITAPPCTFAIVDDFGAEIGLILWNSRIVISPGCGHFTVISNTGNVTQTPRPSFRLYAEEFPFWIDLKQLEEMEQRTKKPEQVQKQKVNETTTTTTIPTTAPTETGSATSTNTTSATTELPPMYFPYKICDGREFDCRVPANCTTACKVDINGESGCLTMEDCAIHDHPRHKVSWKLCDMTDGSNPRIISWCQALVEGINGTVEVVYVEDCDRFHNFWSDDRLNRRVGDIMELDSPLIFQQRQRPWMEASIILRPNETVTTSRPKPGTTPADPRYLFDPRVEICFKPTTCNDFLYLHCELQRKDQNGKVRSTDLQEHTRQKLCSAINLTLPEITKQSEFDWKVVCTMEKVWMLNFTDERTGELTGRCIPDTNRTNTPLARWHWRFLNATNVTKMTCNDTSGESVCHYSRHYDNLRHIPLPDLGHLFFYKCCGQTHQACFTGKPTQFHTQDLEYRCEPEKPKREDPPADTIKKVTAGPVIGVIVVIVIVLLGAETGILYLLRLKPWAKKD